MSTYYTNKSIVLLETNKNVYTCWHKELGYYFIENRKQYVRTDKYPGLVVRPMPPEEEWPDLVISSIYDVRMDFT